MIKPFKSKDTERIFLGEYSRKFPEDIQQLAGRKLEMLAAATQLKSLRIPPSNRLKRLKGIRQGQYSIRVNDQWRICFFWESGNAYKVEIVDYH